MKLFLLFCLLVCGQTESDVPEIATREIGMRGSMVQEIGTIQADEIDVIADALAPPEDDSHKWFITVVVDGGKASEKLKLDVIQEPSFKAWVNVDEPMKSSVHYHVRLITDETQQDWLAGIKPKIAELGGCPAIVIQPPRSGEYGKNSTVVGVLGGYDGDAEKMVNRLRASVAQYVSALHKKGLITHVGDNVRRESGGHAQYEGVGAPPPFQVPSKPLDPVQPNGPVDWPQIQPKPTPKPETDPNFPPAQPDMSGSQVLLILLGVVTVASLTGTGYCLWILTKKSKRAAYVRPSRSDKTPQTNAKTTTRTGRSRS